MACLNIRPRAECKYDIVSLGEVMIRLDPGDERIHTTRNYRVWDGGSEYNVVRGLKRCFAKEAAIVLEDLIYQGGVGMEYVRWVFYDGIGNTTQVVLNITEHEFGVRAAVGYTVQDNFSECF